MEKFTLKSKQEVSMRELQERFRKTVYACSKNEYAFACGRIALKATGVLFEPEGWVINMRFFADEEFVGSKTWECAGPSREVDPTIEYFLEEVPKRAGIRWLSKDVAYLEGGEKMFNSDTGYVIRVGEKRIAELGFFDAVDLAKYGAFI